MGVRNVFNPTPSVAALNPVCGGTSTMVTHDEQLWEESWRGTVFSPAKQWT